MPRVIQRLRHELQTFAAPDALAASAAMIGTPVVNRPLIVLVASISGGTGSGMVLDLAYAVRKLAAEIGLAQYELRGLLLHATEEDGAARELAQANALACLTELAQFNRPGGGYPGEAALGITAVPSILPTFDETLIAHLGDGLDSTAFQSRSDRGRGLFVSPSRDSGRNIARPRARLAGCRRTCTLRRSPARARSVCTRPTTCRPMSSKATSPGSVRRWPTMVGYRGRSAPRSAARAVATGDEVTEKVKRLVELALGPQRRSPFRARPCQHFGRQHCRRSRDRPPAWTRALPVAAANWAGWPQSLRTLRDCASGNRRTARPDGRRLKPPGPAVPAAFGRSIVSAAAGGGAGDPAGQRFAGSFFARQRRAGERQRVGRADARRLDPPAADHSPGRSAQVAPADRRDAVAARHGPQVGGGSRSALRTC